jgi:hypothetical protein
MEKGIKHGSPSLSRNMASTMRKVGRTLCKRLAPWRPIHNGAVPKAHGNERVASSWLDTATCVREIGAAEGEDVFGGGTLVYAVLVSREGEERGFLRLRDPVIIPGPKELERHDAELSNADKEGGEEEAMEAAAQPVEDEEFSAEENMECLPEDDAKISGASMEALTLLAAEEGGGTSAGIDTTRGPASLNSSAGGATTEPRRPCAAQSYKEVSVRAAQVPILLPAGTEPFIGEKSYAQAIFGRRICREFFFRKGSAPPTYDPPGGASSDAALDDLLVQKAKFKSTMRDKTEPSKILSLGSLRTQQVYETRKKEQNEYAEHGISRLHDVVRHLTDLVVKRLIMTACRPKAWRAFARSGNGGGDSDHDKNEGPKSKRKRRAQTVLRTVNKKIDTTKPGKLPQKRKATEDAGGRSRPSAPSAALVPPPAVTPLSNAAHKNLRQTSTRSTPKVLEATLWGTKPTTPLLRPTPTQHLSSTSERRPRHKSRGGRE